MPTSLNKAFTSSASKFISSVAIVCEKKQFSTIHNGWIWKQLVYLLNKLEILCVNDLILWKCTYTYKFNNKIIHGTCYKFMLQRLKRATFPVTPYTITPYTQTPYTIHANTIHHTRYTMHHTPYTQRLYTIHHTRKIIHHPPYTLQHTPYTIRLLLFLTEVRKFGSI